MKKIILGITSAATLTFVSCADITTPLAVTSNKGVSSKMGESKSVSILGLLQTGDAGINTARKSAGINEVHHVDVHTTRVLGVLEVNKTQVYGK